MADAFSLQVTEDDFKEAIGGNIRSDLGPSVPRKKLKNTVKDGVSGILDAQGKYTPLDSNQ